MNIKNSYFADFGMIGALSIKLSDSLSFEMSDTSFVRCTRTGKPGGAVCIEGNSLNVTISRCCGVNCMTNSYDNGVDFGQFIYVSGSSGFTNLTLIVVCMCPEKLVAALHHGALSVKGSANFETKNINCSNNEAVLGPCFCGFLVSSYCKVSFSIASNCTSNENSINEASATTIFQANHAIFENILFIKCKCKYEMTCDQIGTFINCIIYKCKNYNINFLGDSNKIEDEPSPNFTVLRGCSNIRIISYKKIHLSIYVNVLFSFQLSLLNSYS